LERELDIFGILRDLSSLDAGILTVPEVEFDP
jgi:hypothetical protein